MTEIMAFEIYRRETIEMNGRWFNVQFTRKKDGEEYALFALSDDGGVSWRAVYSAETALDFSRCNDAQLSEAVYAMFKSNF